MASTRSSVNVTSALLVNYAKQVGRFVSFGRLESLRICQGSARLIVLIIFFADIDDCSSALCLNGATCIDGVASYTCICPPGKSGIACEIGNA